MRKFLSLIVLLSISSMLSFGQKQTFLLENKKSLKENNYENFDGYLSKNVKSTYKSTPIWSDNFANSSNWTINKQPGTIGNWAVISDTGAASTAWKNFWSDENIKSPTANQGVAYFDGIYQFVNQITGAENSWITTTSPINLSAYSAVSIKFFQLYYSFNSDSTLLEISSDNINWHTIMANADITANGNANTFRTGWKEFNITQWAANKPQVWLRFRFNAKEKFGTPPSTNFGGGYGWMIDDVSLFTPNNNILSFDNITLFDGYTNIPAGLGRPMFYEASFTNMGAFQQTNIKLHGVELTTLADTAGLDTVLLPGKSVIDWTTNDYFFTPSTVGDYKVTAYLSSDSIPYLGSDTFNIKVVPLQGALYSRDYNTYTTSRWAGVNDLGQVEGYTATNRYVVSQNAMSYGIDFVVNAITEVGADVKVVLYEGRNRTIKATSDYYSIKASDIPAGTGPNPPSIKLAFTTPYLLKKDSTYLAGVQCMGGTDTVRIAVDGTSIPQNDQTSIYYVPSKDDWYIWDVGNVQPTMIRLSFDPTIGINEVDNNVNLLYCMPNPANNVTTISYELKNTNKVSILVSDITGRTVRTINQGTQTSGSYSLELNLTDLTSGTYFYTLKTENSQTTKKLIIVKR